MNLPNAKISKDKNKNFTKKTPIAIMLEGNIHSTDEKFYFLYQIN